MTTRIPLTAVRRGLELLILLIFVYILAVILPSDLNRLVPEPRVSDAALLHRIARDEDVLAASYLEAGGRAEDKGQFAAAAGFYRKAAVIVPTAPGYAALVRSLVSANDLPQARSALAEALDRFPDDAGLGRLDDDISAD